MIKRIILITSTLLFGVSASATEFDLPPHEAKRLFDRFVGAYQTSQEHSNTNCPSSVKFERTSYHNCIRMAAKIRVSNDRPLYAFSEVFCTGNFETQQEATAWLLLPNANQDSYVSLKNAFSIQDSRFSTSYIFSRNEVLNFDLRYAGLVLTEVKTPVPKFTVMIQGFFSDSALKKQNLLQKLNYDCHLVPKIENDR